MTIVQALFQDPLTFDNDEIKIRLEAEDRDERFYKNLRLPTPYGDGWHGTTAPFVPGLIGS